VTVRVKICGITRLEDALLALELGADALGFVFVDGSPRRVTPEQTRVITAALPPLCARVGVFADEAPRAMEATALVAGLTCLQLHGDETPESCRALTLPWYKAHRVGDDFDLERLRRFGGAAFLLDAAAPGALGGTGRSFDWSVARRAAGYGRVILAGGLTPDNIEAAITAARPYAVDVSSGVESAPGRKDGVLLKRFIERTRRAAARPGSEGE
jgi:phosphoribosylanthranilate isomerase